MGKKESSGKTSDVILIGAGIMSATLAVLLKQLQPDISIHIFERLDVAAAESSDAWNNAGTGHSAFCELNYTPENEQGEININKAMNIAESFEVSKQLWAWLVQQRLISLPLNFIQPVPHMSLVWGKKDVAYLRKRYDLLTACHLFKGMEYTENAEVLKDWMPIIMHGRENVQELAATRMNLGTDVNFGTLTRSMFDYLQQQPGINLHFNAHITDIDRKKNNLWSIKVKDLITGEKHEHSTSFVFIGAGGGSLPLLLKSDIPEGKSYGGFPVSGQWLKCNNQELIEKHYAKVYGKAKVGAPPMSVPHLDTRIIKGKKELLFGPYAGFSMKFLKEGSSLDLAKSLRFSNIYPMLAAGIQNIPLTKYLIEQVRQSPEEKMEALQEFVPLAKLEDWELEIAGQRVQVIKKDEEEGGILEFGTEIVSASDGSLAALLGASPGASTAVSIMINLLHRCFNEKVQSASWQTKLQEMIPSYGKDLTKDENLAMRMRAWTSEVLDLQMPEK